MSRPPDEVPGYELLGTIHEGAGSSVYRARERATGRACALKVLRTREASSPAEAERQRRFLEEGRRLLGFAHHNVVEAFDIGSSEGCAWIAQELVEGPSLQQLLDAQGGPLPLDAALGVAFQLGRALEALAQADIVHRDIAPSNVIVSAAGVAKLCDFGASFESGVAERLSHGRVPAGTVDFMSPEQVEGEAAPSPKCDVYGLGATLYRCLAGRTPHSGSTLFARLRSIVHDAPPDLRELNPALPDAIAALVARFMERDADDRPISQDAAPFVLRVAQALGLARAADWERAALVTLLARTGARASGEEPVVEPGVAVRLRGTDRTIERALAVGDVMEVGRSAESAVSLPFGWISRRHARIERRPDGVWLVDLGSANGTTLNRARVKDAARLHTGDLLAFGKSRFEVSISEPSEHERGCLLCGQALAEDEAGVCRRCRRDAESDVVAAEDRIVAALQQCGFEVGPRLGGRGGFRRYTARARGKAYLVSALEVGARAAEAFAAESQRARELDHPAIWPVLRVEAHRGVLLVVGPEPDGPTLEGLVGQQGPLPAAATTRLGRDLADALDHATGHGLVHALVRPEVVLVTHDRRPRLLDVGLSPALLEAARAPVETGAPLPVYDAPEVTAAGLVTPRAQVYALGATLSFALTGNPVAEVVAGERRDLLPLTMVSGVPRQIAYLLACATSPDPADRPPTPAALRNALDALLAEAQDQRRRPPPPEDDVLDEDELTRPIELDDLPPEILFDP
ncbi:MAG: protein kinase [Planctomycetes bacterium]|nr:protein kinase [Planctomycetota bacterium]